jgi:hypothetical protein
MGHIAIFRHFDKRVTFISCTVLKISIGSLYFGKPVVAHMFKKYYGFCEALKDHYHVHKSLPLFLIMSQINPQHKKFNWRMVFNIIVSCTTKLIGPYSSGFLRKWSCVSPFPPLRNPSTWPYHRPHEHKIKVILFKDRF